MNNIKYLVLFALAAITLPFVESCSPAGGTSTGHEYMPDMAHPISYETNVYDDYSYNSWNTSSVIDRKTLSNPRMPIGGTIPRGYVGYSEDKLAMYSGEGSNSAIRTPMNGNVPYRFADTEEERTRATNEYYVTNPFPITKDGLEKGKELYNTYCGQSCHGLKGNGQGYLVSEENLQAKYPAQPANFCQDQFYTSNNGRYYHAIMYGKNVMQAHADKLSYEERWQVIHYIRSLQASAKGVVYSEKENTFDPKAGTPYAVVAAAKAAATPKVEAMTAATKTTETAHKGAAHGAGGGHRKK